MTIAPDHLEELDWPTPEMAGKTETEQTPEPVNQGPTPQRPTLLEWDRLLDERIKEAEAAQLEMVRDRGYDGRTIPRAIWEDLCNCSPSRGQYLGGVRDVVWTEGQEWPFRFRDDLTDHHLTDYQRIGYEIPMSFQPTPRSFVV